MGAHTLGSAKRENSNYRGPWIVDQTQVFDNTYYSYMVDASINWVNTVTQYFYNLSLVTLYNYFNV